MKDERTGLDATTDASLEARAKAMRRAFNEAQQGHEWGDIAPWIAALTSADASRPGLTEEQARALIRHARALARVARITLKKPAGYYSFRTTVYGEADALRARDRKSRASRGETGPAPTGLTSFMADAQQRPSVPPASPFGEWPEPEHDGDPQKTATLAGAGTGND